MHSIDYIVSVEGRVIVFHPGISFHKLERKLAQEKSSVSLNIMVFLRLYTFFFAYQLSRSTIIMYAYRASNNTFQQVHL